MTSLFSTDFWSIDDGLSSVRAGYDRIRKAMDESEDTSAIYDKGSGIHEGFWTEMFSGATDEDAAALFETALSALVDEDDGTFDQDVIVNRGSEGFMTTTVYAEGAPSIWIKIEVAKERGGYFELHVDTSGF